MEQIWRQAGEDEFTFTPLVSFSTNLLLRAPRLSSFQNPPQIEPPSNTKHRNMLPTLEKPVQDENTPTASVESPGPAAGRERDRLAQLERDIELATRQLDLWGVLERRKAGGSEKKVR